jgi:hypothetical protein
MNGTGSKRSERARLVVRKESEGWRIVLFQNTPARLDGRPEAVTAMSRELRAVAEQQLGRGSANA